MQFETLPIDQLNPAPYNPRVALKPGDPEFESLRRSIEHWGLVDPIIWNRQTGRVVGGHQRLAVARALGWTEVPVSVVELEETEEKALNVALNRIEGLWDEDSLEKLLKELNAEEFDLSLTGFDEQELEVFLEEATRSNREPSGGTRDKSRAVYQEEEDTSGESDLQVTEEGDIWILGDHRLMCGDAQSREHVTKLLQRDKVDQLVTDPPYGVNDEEKQNSSSIFSSKGRKENKISNDAKQGTALGSLLQTAFQNIPWAEYNTAYIFFSSTEVKTILEATEAAGIRWAEFLIWLKNKIVPSRKDYNFQHELIFYGWRNKHKFHGPTNASTVLDYARPQSSELHPTMKPIPLLEQLIQDGSKENAVVLDLFSGSGSTLIACETQGRRGRAIEIDPVYVDRSIRRWQKISGKKALLTDGTPFDELEDQAKAQPLEVNNARA